MNRREFIALAASAAAIPQISVAKQSDLARAIEDLERAIRKEMPDLKRVEITYDPTHAVVPLMILAARI